MYNTSLCEGYLPPLLKSAAVIPIRKKCPANDIEKDIRPISLTCQIAKVLERFTLTRVLSTILPQLDKKQFAVTGKSTEQAIVYILHLALEALDKGNCSLRLFFADFSKGFDLIDHRILMEKLSNTSTEQYTNGGIPQGTKLALIFFAVMVSDLISTCGPMIKFVD